MAVVGAHCPLQGGETGSGFRNPAKVTAREQPNQDSNPGGASLSLAADYALGKDCIMHGYMSKMGNPFLTQWQRRYFYLFPNRLEWRGEGEAPVRIRARGRGAGAGWACPVPSLPLPTPLPPHRSRAC